jgi:hypothetical protein
MAQQTNELAAVVLQKINDFVPDALAKETKLCSILTGNGKKQQKGGLLIQCPIKLIANTAKGAISGTGSVLDLTPSQQLQYMTFNWKYYNWNVGFTLADYNIANGPEQVVDFMETKIEGALQDAVRDWSLMFNGSSASSPLNFDGLLDWTAASGTAYGSLTDTDYAAGTFLPLIYTDALSNGVTGGFTTINYNNFNVMSTALRLRVRGFGKGKKIFSGCNGYVYSRLKTSLQNQQIFINESDFIKAGFLGFEIDGIDVYPDSDAPGSATAGTNDNYLYMLPEDILKFWYHFGFGTKSPFDGEVRVPNQTIESYQNFVTGNPIVTNRRLIAVATKLG